MATFCGSRLIIPGRVRGGRVKKVRGQAVAG